MGQIDVFLYVTPLWILGAAYLILLLCAGALGVLLGRWARARRGEQEGSQMGVVLAAMLGLLGLLLAFSYAQAATRYDLRNQLMVSEVNAISTVWLRSSFLPEPQRGELRDLLKKYVDLRIATDDPRLDLARVRERIATAEALQKEMWKVAISPSQKQPPTLLDNLLISSVNEMIDLHTSRLASYENRLPSPVLGLLAFASTLALLLMGFSFGAAQQRALGPLLALALVIAAVTLSILDLDRVHRGAIRVSQARMVELQKSLQAEK